MQKKTIKVSLKPSKLIIFFLIAVAVIAVIFFTKENSKKTTTNDTLDVAVKEIILPRETGVADSGFELNNASGFTALNAKTTLDALEVIYGKKSLKISFLEGANASVKIGNYINNIGAGNFYRLGFWARTDAPEGKTIQVSIGGENGSQELGNFSLADLDDVRYYEFNFQPENDVSDLIFTSTDGNKADVWVDDIIVERIEIESAEQLKDIRPTIFGSTSRFNVDQSQTDDDGDSDAFFATPNRKMGQIVKPTLSLISGVALKIQKVGTGGAGDYHLQIREYDEKLGVISDEVLATRKIYTTYPTSFLKQIEEKEKEMKEEFDQNESDIKEGRTPNDPTVDQYPPDYTQKQIDDSKAQKRKDKFALAISEMKESFNVPYELTTPISVKVDTDKKYWIGIDSAGVKTDKRNHIKVFSNSEAPENELGFSSKETGAWEEYYSLWFKTFYPKHAQVQGETVLTGATISDYGDKLVYRYQFNDVDYLSLSGFPGRKIYDIFESNFKQSNKFGNYNLSSDQYVIYRFNTIYPVEKVIIRNANYDQSLAIDFSSDGNNWKEIVSDDPGENKQNVGPIVTYPDSKMNTFYLKIMPAGNSCVLSELDLEAELEKSGLLENLID